MKYTVYLITNTVNNKQYAKVYKTNKGRKILERIQSNNNSRNSVEGH